MKYALISILLIITGCSVDDPDVQAEDEPFIEHGELSDFDDIIVKDSKGDETALRFDEDSIVSDELFIDSEMLSESQIQAFLEDTPYNRPTWLASEQVNGRPVSALIAETAQQYKINPLMLIARFQVEGSHISRAQRPSDFSAERALGCGCFDGEQCKGQYLGMQKQLTCAATVLRRKFDESTSGKGAWVKGVSKKTLDPAQVTPESHATAALYAYTPWVLPRRGGNWLVWNITQRYLAHIPTDSGSNSWVGDACSQDADCDFSDKGTPGFCFTFTDNGAATGICTVPCEGLCPDRNGEPFTFCVRSDTEGVGICVEREDASNSSCGDFPNSYASLEDRFVGRSGASASQKRVCMPNNLRK